ncbi:4'-phosphopantetheinyl transferase [Pseudoalteromonas rubra]|uniref:4'-phosphopantetheinyl transferase n=1 Tax=Pseudoalteromonas rubra TaxID=43658 RepID=A0A5S3WKL2_9GAMM|nr:4'-phosphopantetheinyl transferase superfamily protein [Pseudoalteromonas rubra]TMP27264.1 4'-phosphopantetheinyl transferase [Pseudoalteromonas rubra]TMP36802.1 4'-phosphopantetheinyl transferase [Pseudoalteromonas rubra]
MISQHTCTPVGETHVSPTVYIGRSVDNAIRSAPRLAQGLIVKQLSRTLASLALQDASHTSSIRLAHTASGQPYGEPGKGQPKVPLSISHSGPWAAVACAAHPVGIDLQVYRGFSAGAQQHIFCDKAKPASVVTQTARWSVCEAYLKSFGRGLPFDLSDIAIQKYNTSGTTEYGRVYTHSASLAPASYWLWHTLYFCCAVCIAGDWDITPTLSLHIGK